MLPGNEHCAGPKPHRSRPHHFVALPGTTAVLELSPPPNTLPASKDRNLASEKQDNEANCANSAPLRKRCPTQRWFATCRLPFCHFCCWDMEWAAVRFTLHPPLAGAKVGAGLLSWRATWPTVVGCRRMVGLHHHRARDHLPRHLNPWARPLTGRVRASTEPGLQIAINGRLTEGRPPPAPGRQNPQSPLLPLLPLLPLTLARARRIGLSLHPPAMTRSGRALTQNSRRSSMAMRSPSWKMACDFVSTLVRGTEYCLSLSHRPARSK